MDVENEKEGNGPQSLERQHLTGPLSYMSNFNSTIPGKVIIQ